MTEPVPFESSSQQARALIKQAILLMHLHGYSATGVAELALAAGVKKGSFYYWFDSKEALTASAIGRYSEKRAAFRRRALAAGDGEPLQRLLEYFGYLEHCFAKLGYRRGCFIGNMALEASDSSEAIRGAVVAALDDWERDLAAVVSEAQVEGSLDSKIDSTAVAHEMLSRWQGALLQMKTRRSGEPLRAFIRTLLPNLRINSRSAAPTEARSS